MQPAPSGVRACERIRSGVRGSREGLDKSDKTKNDRSQTTRVSKAQLKL